MAMKAGPEKRRRGEYRLLRSMDLEDVTRVPWTANEKSQIGAKHSR